MTNSNEHISTSSITYFKRVGFLLTGAFAIRLIFFSLLWILFTGWKPESWVIGIFFVMMASLLSLHLAPKNNSAVSRFNLKYLPSFLYYFSAQSIRGGWSTARLALTPTKKTSPGFYKYQTDFVNPSDIFTFMQILSLLPGTVSTDENNGEITLHVLDIHCFDLAEVEKCYQLVCQLLNIRADR